MIIRGFLLLVTAILFIGCAPTGNLNLYPQRQIDRPYTLPKGIAAWQPEWYSDKLKSSVGSSNSTDFSVLIWTQSLSDDLNIIWAPLPLALRYQIGRSESNVYGVSAGISKLAYKSDDKWTIGMGISGYQRHQFADWLALVTTLSLENVIRTKSNSSDSWGAEFAAGPLFQISNDIAVLPKIHYAYERNFPSVIDIPDQLQSKTYKLIPLSVTIGWNLGRQWELQALYLDKRIGYSDDIREESIAIRMVNYW
jgi:hypothetical protein